MASNNLEQVIQHTERDVGLKSMHPFGPWILISGLSIRLLDDLYVGDLSSFCFISPPITIR